MAQRKKHPPRFARGDRVMLPDGRMASVVLEDDEGNALVWSSADANGLAIPDGHRYALTPAAKLVRA